LAGEDIIKQITILARGNEPSSIPQGCIKLGHILVFRGYRIRSIVIIFCHFGTQQLRSNTAHLLNYPTVPPHFQTDQSPHLIWQPVSSSLPLQVFMQTTFARQFGFLMHVASSTLQYQLWLGLIVHIVVVALVTASITEQYPLPMIILGL
jgi:hypothetical protein